VSKTGIALLLAAAFWGIAGLGAWTVASALRTGQLRSGTRARRAVTLTRSDNPAMFWFYIVLATASTAVCAYLGTLELGALF